MTRGGKLKNKGLVGTRYYAVTIQNLIKGKANKLSTFRSNKAGGSSENGIFAQGKV